MPRFLVCDDDPACRRLHQIFLAQYGECDLARDGQEAVAAFRKALKSGDRYDLVCLDLMMPGVDGHRALDAIRAIESEYSILGSNRTKVIVVTALRDSKQCVQVFREGCEGFLTKPVREADLIREVERLLGALPAPSHPAQGTDASAVESSLEKPAPRARYLIVDDDAVCRMLLRDMLAPYAECDMAYDGREAIDAVRLAIDDGRPYDLICLDIMMPGLSGHETLEAIRQLESQRGVLGSDGVKVVMTTALRDAKHCTQAFREGCESYVIKPIREQHLLATLENLGVLELSHT